MYTIYIVVALFCATSGYLFLLVSKEDEEGSSLLGRSKFFCIPLTTYSSKVTKSYTTVWPIIIDKYGCKMYVSVLVKFVMITKGKKIQQQ